MGILDSDDGEFAKLNLYDDNTVSGDEFYSNNRTRQLSPERRLLLAILDNAIEFVRKKSKKDPETQKSFHEEACAWIMTDDDEDCFSFNSVCQMLNIEPSYLRKALVAKYPILAMPIIRKPPPEPKINFKPKRRAKVLCRHHR